MFPTLFISHGAPNELIKDTSFKKNLNSFAKKLLKPKFILIISAHYLTDELMITDLNASGQLYDFDYEIKSNKDIASKVMNSLKNDGFPIQEDKNRKTFDHGVWSVLAMMYKKLDIPVIQLSLPNSYSARKLIELGGSLQALKEEAMIISSGGITHNLSQMSFQNRPKQYALDFVISTKKALELEDKEQLLALLEDTNFKINHPSSEHFLPLYVAFGSAKNKKPNIFNEQMALSNISMLNFSFDKE